MREIETYHLEMRQVKDFISGFRMQGDEEDQTKEEKYLNVKRLDLEFDSMKCKLIIMSDVTD